MDAPVINSLLPYYGAKRTIAPAIVAEIGPHSVYWEPFAGSMAVLLSKPRSRTEVVNDLHGDLINLARVIQSPELGPKLYRALRRVLFSEALYRDALTALEDTEPPTADGPPDWHRAYGYFVASWMGMNGKAGTDKPGGTFCRRYTSNGGDPARRWAGAVRSIPQWRRRLEGVQILSGDGIDLCGRIEDKAGTVIFADPPYLAKGARYLHDFDGGDHARLAEALNRFRRTRVVVSYYEHERLSALYPGWRAVPVAAPRSMANANRPAGSGAAGTAPEVLLVNDGPPSLSR